MNALTLYKHRDFVWFQEQASEFIRKVENFPSLDDTEGIELFVHFSFCSYLLDSPVLWQFLEKPMKSLPFIDFNAWEFIEPLLLLKVRCGKCTRTKGKERVEEALNSGDELSQKVNRSVFLRTLKGEHLDLDTLNSIFNAKTKWSNVFHLVILAMDIVRIAELGGSEAFPVARAHELLEECKIKFQASFGIV